MDITPYLDMKPAPRAVFDSLTARAHLPRFYVPKADGGYSLVTWQDFADEIREVALFLQPLLGKEDRACVLAPNSVAWASAALAIQSAAGVMVPIYPASTAEQIGYVASHSDAKLIFVDTPALLARLFECWSELSHVNQIVLLSDTVDAKKTFEDWRARTQSSQKEAISAQDVAARVVAWSDAKSAGRAVHEKNPSAFDALLSSVSLDQLGMMLYTSGTSGNPKGVPLSHRNVAVNGQDWLVCNGPQLGENNVDILWLPMSHIFGFGEMCLGNTLGFTTYLSDPATCLTKMPTLKPTVFMSVPSHWEKLAQMSMHEPTQEGRVKKFVETTGGRLQFCLSGGAGLKREVKDFFYACGVLIIEGYGLTETSPTLTLNRPDSFRFDSVGKPLPSVELKLAEDGEILARGANVFRGYHKDEAATREAFTADGWFQTGDVGRFTEDGFLQIIDRTKDILVTAGGKNVPPANIEIRFGSDPIIAHVVVYGDAKKFLVAGVWLNEAVVRAELEAKGTTPDHMNAARRDLVAERVEKVNQGLASYESIKKFSIMSEPLTVEGGLLTASFKVRRKKVYDAFKPQFEAMYAENDPARPAVQHA
ncbi:MAG: AMP-dependent synthetase/ligase [Polyangiaceae bacterium]